MNWQGKRVLVTGAGGFIGSHLTEHLVREGAAVRALVHYNALASHGWLSRSPLRDDCEIVMGDVTDGGSVRQALRDREVVFHLAALIGIPYSYVAPASYVRTNINGTLNVLEAARSLGTERIVQTSTSEVYGSARYTPIDEEHPLQGQSPYSATKIAADKLAESFFRSFDTPVVTVRPFNTFGPRQSTRAVIPTIISQCLRRAEAIHLGSLSPRRDFNYVTNTVEGFVRAAAAEDVVGEVINIGYGEDISIGDLAALIIEETGVSARITSEDSRVRPEKSEVNRLLAANDKARERIGWTPAVSLREGLRHTIDWMRDNLGNYRQDGYAI